MRTMFLAAAICAVAPSAASSPAFAQQAVAAPGMADVLADSRRDGDRARDRYRHPAETLAFMRVEPGMTVVDFMPAGGWYSRVLIPYLGPTGTYIGLDPEIPDDATGYMAGMRNTRDRLPARAREWVSGEGAQVIGSNLDDVPADLHGTADRFLIFREMHNIRSNGWLDAVLGTAGQLLKDDGLIGVVQHRAKPDAPDAYVDGSKGYLRQDDVVAWFAERGYELAEGSEINANPGDPADWPDGVWTLPPGYRGTEASDTAGRAELDAIGESDRMTLLFRKAE